MLNHIDNQFEQITPYLGQHITPKNLKAFLYELKEPMTSNYIFGVLSGRVPEPSVNTHIILIFGKHYDIYNRLQEAPTTNSQEHQLRYSFTDKNYTIPKAQCHIRLLKDHLLGKTLSITAPKSNITIECNVLSALRTLSAAPKGMFKTSLDNVRNLRSLINKG